MRYPGSESSLETCKRNTPMQKISCTLASEIFRQVAAETAGQLLILN